MRHYAYKNMRAIEGICYGSANIVVYLPYQQAMMMMDRAIKVGIDFQFDIEIYIRLHF